MIEVASELTLRETIKNHEIESRVGNALMQQYPTRDWYVEGNVSGGTVTVKCASVSMTYGMTIHLHSGGLEPVIRTAVKQAGELLERFNLGRDRLNSGDDESYLPRNLRDEVLTAQQGEA